MKAALSSLLVLGLVGLAAVPASAATATATLAVSAQVVATCSVTGNTLAFGNYSPISPSPTDGSTTVSVACTRGTSATIGMGLGSFASGSVRRMSDGAATPSFLSYELYSDAGRTTVWGNASGSWITYVAPSNATQNFTVYGRVTALQDVGVATFNDAVAITVTF